MNLNIEDFPSHKKPLVKAILSYGKSIHKFAAAVGVNHQNVHVWLYQNKLAPPAEYCAKIEAVTFGAVTKEELRPDIFYDIPAKETSISEQISGCINLLNGIMCEISGKGNKKKGRK